MNHVDDGVLMMMCFSL